MLADAVCLLFISFNTFTSSMLRVLLHDWLHLLLLGVNEFP